MATTAIACWRRVPGSELPIEENDKPPPIAGFTMDAVMGCTVVLWRALPELFAGIWPEAGRPCDWFSGGIWPEGARP